MQLATLTSTSNRRLTARQLDEIRAALLQQQTFRTEQLAELAAAAQCSATPGGGDCAYDEIADALRAGATAALDDIHSALSRIETCGFGVCTACSAAIPIERLEILPMNPLCMQCARVRSAAR